MWFAFGFFSLIGFVVYSLYERASAKWIGTRASVHRKTYEYQVLERRFYSNDTAEAVGLRIGVTAPAAYDFSFKPEKWRDWLSKRIGFSVEHQTGDAEFDKTVYILSNDARIHATLSQNAALRADILRGIQSRGATFGRPERSTLFRRQNLGSLQTKDRAQPR